jgi:hypothetical protein
MSILGTIRTAMHGVRCGIGITVAAVGRSIVELDGLWVSTSGVICGSVSPSRPAALVLRTSGATCTASLQTAIVACANTDEGRNDDEACTPSNQVPSRFGLCETAPLVGMAVSFI